MTWLRHFLGKDVVAWLVWAGLRAVPPKAAALESVLRMKFLLLFAITLKRRSFRRATLMLWHVKTPIHCSVAHDRQAFHARWQLLSALQRQGITVRGSMLSMCCDGSQLTQHPLVAEQHDVPVSPSSLFDIVLLVSAGGWSGCRRR